MSLEHLVNGVFPLDHFKLVLETVARQLDDAAARDAVKDKLVVERGGDKLQGALLGAPDDEEVAGSRLGTVPLGSVQPKDLAKAALTRLVGGQQTGTVVGTDLGVAEAADPGADHVLRVGVQAHPPRGSVHARHERGCDEEEGLLGRLNAQLGLGADHGRAKVQIAPGAGAGQPLGPVDSHEGEDKALKLARVEPGQGDAERRHEHARGVAVRAEQPEPAVIAPVRLESLKALGRVVQH
ncbi:hypothetical protein VTI28DRAFT_6811 [Corynascus sepedonium]